MPKIASYELNYNFFDSPFPLIYFVKSEVFKSEKLKGKNLSGKILVFLEADIIDFCGDFEEKNDSGGKKELKKLEGRLEEYAGRFNRECLEVKKKRRGVVFEEDGGDFG